MQDVAWFFICFALGVLTPILVAVTAVRWLRSGLLVGRDALTRALPSLDPGAQP